MSVDMPRNGAYLSNQEVQTETSETMDTLIDRLTSRHIAKLLTRLGDTVAPVIESEIKREFRFLADDIKQIHTEKSNEYNETNGNH